MSHANESSQPIGTAPNANRLLCGGFMAILAAGIGFAIRGGFLDNWRGEFGFTDTELGNITGAGGPGFCFGIIIGGIICDKIGYGKLVISAFVLHLLSAVVTFAADPSMGKETSRLLLYWGSFIFAYANGTLEAVANPLVATLFFHNRTHYLNILHASWPAGLVIGSASGWVLDDIFHVGWKMQFALFLIPTVLYGIFFFAQHFPKSEASQKGLKLGEMFQDVGILVRWSSACSLRFFCRCAGTTFDPSQCVAPAGGIGVSVRLLHQLCRWYCPGDRRRRADPLLDWFVAAVYAVHRPRPRRCGGTRHGQLYSVHHRQYPDLRRGEMAVRIHLVSDVRAAVLRGFH